MKKVFLSILTGLVLFASCTEQKHDEGRETKIPENAFPIIYHGHLYITGEADGVLGNYLFDTGASNFYFDSTYFADSSFSYSNLFDALAPGVGNKPQKVKVITDVVSFAFHENVYRPQNVPIVKLKPIVGDIADGILGIEYFKNSVLEINYEKEYMQIFESIDSIDISGYSKIKLTNKNNRLYIPLTIGINDSIKILGEATVDFGSGGSLSLTRPTAEQYNLSENISSKVGFYTKYGGLGGESSSFNFFAQSLQIGDYNLKDIEMDYSTDKKGAMASNRHIGLLGNDIYDRFDLIIDFINNDLYIRANKSFSNPFKASKLGFAYVNRYKTLKSWIVTGLYKGFNAEKSGLKVDDQILSVNGVDVGNLDYKSARDFLKDLTDIELKVKSEGEIKVICFKLEPVLKLDK